MQRFSNRRHVEIIIIIVPPPSPRHLIDKIVDCNLPDRGNISVRFSISRVAVVKRLLVFYLSPRCGEGPARF